jgi:hypothetical protein
MRPVRIDLPAEAARTLMLERIASQPEPELSDMVIVRSLVDCADYDMPPFMIAYLAHIFGRES